MLTKKISQVIEIRKVTTDNELQSAFLIRTLVFVEEQNVPAEEEYDEYEKEATHFLAFCDNIPCGTARWRFTENGIKLERFAVLKEFRGKGIGQQLVDAVLKDVKTHPQTIDKEIYLHSQLTALPLYSKFGFKQTGSKFEECEIEHFKMIL